MQPWTRWNDWVALVAGVWLFLSPWVLALAPEVAPAWNFWIVGVLMVVAALVALANPAMLGVEWATLILGVWMFLSPWLLGYSAVANAAWNAWIVGLVAVIVSALAIPTIRTAQEGTERKV